MKATNREKRILSDEIIEDRLAAVEWRVRAERAEAELARLKKRAAAAPGGRG